MMHKYLVRWTSINHANTYYVLLWLIMTFNTSSGKNILIPDKRAIDNRKTEGVEGWCRAITDSVGKAWRDVTLGNTFTYQMGVTVVLVRVLWHDHVSEISSRDSAEILQSHLRQRDVQPAPHCFHWMRVWLKMGPIPSYVTVFNTTLRMNIAMWMSQCETTCGGGGDTLFSILN